jgi:beta-1,4-mannosyltransferase
LAARALSSEESRGSSARQPLIRVASVPATHVYVRHLQHPLVERLVDPSGDDLRTPCFLDPDWVAAHSELFDLLHVHFGFEFYPVAQLIDLCDALHANGIPLLYTAHDLRNPNHPSSKKHDGALAVWMEQAAQVVTLSLRAAREIEHRFGRRAHVVPHPHVVPLEQMERLQANRPRHWDGFRVGIHFKSMRPNMAGAPVLRAALDSAHQTDGLRLLVHLHPDVLDPRSPNHDEELAALALSTVCDENSPVDLHVHRYCADDELWMFMLSVDAVILPYRFGTHSGFLEACRDLGTAVIAPTCGAYVEQGAEHSFLSDEVRGVDESSLTKAILEARACCRPPPIRAGDRRRQQRLIAQRYFEIYTTMLSRARHPSSTGGALQTPVMSGR